MANGDWDWLGPVAGAVGVGVGAACTVIAGGWKFLKGLAGSRAEEEIRAVDKRVTILETKGEEERELATRDRKEMLDMMEAIYTRMGALERSNAVLVAQGRQEPPRRR